MVTWYSKDAKAATGGGSTVQWVAAGVSIDTRTLSPGDLYVAIKGDRFDGHDFVAEALKKGAVAAVVSAIPAGMDNAPLLVVGDTLKALEGLGIYARKHSKAKRIGVTGSVGKTSVKEALSLVLADQGKVHGSVGNLNNHIGLPLNLARLPEDADYAVIEMGMNHAGEIAALTQIAKPHVAVITTVEPVHLEYFSSVEAIADAKSEIFEGLEKGGAAVINSDNPHYERMRQHAQKHGSRILSFGMDSQADFKLISSEIVPEGQRIKAEYSGRKLEYTIAGIGQHHVVNSLAVLAAVYAVGADIAKAASSLSKFQLPKGRGKIMPLTLNGVSYTLLEDSYNASPASMGAAFEVLGALKAKEGRRAVAAIGDMLELGSESPAFHKQLSEGLKRNHIDHVFCAGPLMKHLYDALPSSMQGGYAASADELLPLVKSSIREGDLVLIKGSHGSGMWRLAASLIEH